MKGTVLFIITLPQYCRNGLTETIDHARVLLPVDQIDQIMTDQGSRRAILLSSY